MGLHVGESGGKSLGIVILKGVAVDHTAGHLTTSLVGNDSGAAEGGVLGLAPVLDHVADAGRLASVGVVLRGDLKLGEHDQVGWNTGTFGHLTLQVAEAAAVILDHVDVLSGEKSNNSVHGKW